MLFFFLICGTVLVYIRNPEMTVYVNKFLLLCKAFYIAGIRQKEKEGSKVLKRLLV